MAVIVAGVALALLALMVVSSFDKGAGTMPQDTATSAKHEVFPDPGPQENLGFFDIQGVRLGMNKTQVEKALGKNHEDWQILDFGGWYITTKMPLDYVPRHLSSYPPVTAYFDKTGRVNRVDSHDTTYPFNWPTSIVKAELMRKYGRPDLKSTDDKWVYSHKSSRPCAPNTPPKWCPSGKLTEILSAEQKEGGAYLEMGIEEWVMRAAGEPGFILSE
jgi:hypothetical protein